MRGVEFAALILASALITLDGTAVTVALPAIADGLDVPFSRLQWIGNAPLLALAALLLPAGGLADSYGRGRLVRIGLLTFGVASAACAVAPSYPFLIAGRFLQGAGGALVLPAALARLRAAFTVPEERTRKFGVWAAWTGVAAAAGPLLGGALVDLLSWRAVFGMSSSLAAGALVLLGTSGDRDHVRQHRGVPVREATALAIFLGATAYLLIEGGAAGWTSKRILFVALLVPLSLTTVAQGSGAVALFPRELRARRNCMAANGATFALYFGMFGLPFLLVLYTQQALKYSGTWAGAAVLPISVMLFLAEPFGRMTARVGTRRLIALGSIVAAGGMLWIAAGDDPLAFWTHIITGAALFGLGVSMAVSPLTHAAVAAVPETLAGAASGLNHAVVRASGLLAIALLGTLAGSDESTGMSVEGFRRAMWVCGALVGVGGIIGALQIRDQEPGGLPSDADQ
jgi:MFS family permease